MLRKGKLPNPTRRPRIDIWGTFSAIRVKETVIRQEFALRHFERSQCFLRSERYLVTEFTQRLILGTYRVEGTAKGSGAR